jgi:hypothetical protein
MIGEVALAIALIWLGSLFAYSGSLKLLASTDHNVRVVQGYKVVPTWGARLVGLTLPYAELAVGALILLTPYHRLGALATMAFGVAFAIGVGSVLVRGINTGCGCAGTGSDPVGPVTLLRATLIAIAGLAVALAGTPSPSALGWVVFGLALIPAGATATRRFLRRAPIDTTVTRMAGQPPAAT